MLKWLIIVVNNIIMILLSVHWGACRVRAVLSGQHNDAVLMRKRLTQRLHKIKKFNLLLTLSDVIKRLVRIVWPGAISTGTANNGKNVNNTLQVIDLEPSSIAIKNDKDRVLHNHPQIYHIF